jgi:two-component system, OmpR family, sensor histidine kinase MprB
VTLRTRLTVMSAVVVGVILAVGAVLCFVVMRDQLRGQIDDLLREQAALIQRVSARRPAPPAGMPEIPRTSSDSSAPFAQLIRADGSAVGPAGAELPVTAADREVAQGRRRQVLSDRTVDGRHLRVMTVPVSGGGAAQLGRPLTSVDSALARLRLVLIVLAGGGLVLAAGASRLFSRRVLHPIQDLTQATEHIEATGDLERRVDDHRTDEVGRLASSFNAMLTRLESAQREVEASAAAQRHLVADASHELRTPVASLRTNLEVLLSSHALDDASRRTLLADVVEQTEELTSVVSDLIELVRAGLARAARHAPELRYVSDLEPWPMTGSRERLMRAINNLLDNAAKFSPPGSTVRVRLRSGELTVDDEGPGVAADELPHIFDRFFRARDASPYQGSGLGLAIVRQVVHAHGGEVSARPGAGGGLEVAVRFQEEPAGFAV